MKELDRTHGLSCTVEIEWLLLEDWGQVGKGKGKYSDEWVKKED